MAGVYIHIPFCRKKCLYCNFFSLATKKYHQLFFEALLGEIDLTRDYLKERPIETIYFGGGSPGLFTVKQIRDAVEKVRNQKSEDRTQKESQKETGTSNERGRKDEGKTKEYHFLQEITIELNPEDVTPEYIRELVESPVNRISLGIQSFYDEDLEYLGRNHSAAEAEKAMKLIWDTGCQDRSIQGTGEPGIRVSVDLIYGIPTLSHARWKQSLEKIIDLRIPHLSAYALTVEPKTPLAWKIAHRPSPIAHRSSFPIPDEQHTTEQFHILMEMMETAGYLQYEISNFCLPGHQSHHNSAYWKGIPYLGLGPSAHSFDGKSRRWNKASLKEYLEGATKGMIPHEYEILTTDQRYNETVMTSLRTHEGCDLSMIEAAFGSTYSSHFRKMAHRHLQSGHLEEKDGFIRLTRKGKFLADGIAAGLFV